MKLLALGAAIVLAATISGVVRGAEAAGGTAEPQASIHFVQHGGIRNWKADRNEGLWIQGSHRRWYYAKFRGRCFGLNFATFLAFDTRPMGTFDRFSTVIVPGGARCTVRSLVASEGPPRKQMKASTEAATEERG